MTELNKLLDENEIFDNFTPSQLLAIGLSDTTDEETIALFSKIDINGNTLITFLIVNFHMINISMAVTFIIDKMARSSRPYYLLNFKNGYGETPLHISTITNNQLMVSHLVKEKNVDGSIKDNRNFTALDIAILMGLNKEIIIELKKCPTSIMNDIEPSIYQWGEMFTPTLSMGSNEQATRILFNDETNAPIQMEYGKNFNLILTDVGTVYSSGVCSYGKIGQANKRDLILPTMIKELSLNKRIVSIACGDHHSLVLDDLGIAYSFGNGSLGRCGLGSDYKIVSTPTPILGSFNNDRVIYIAAGLDNSFVICSSGDVYGFGSCLNGKAGYISAMGFQSIPKKIEDIEPMIQVACASWHTVLLSRDTGKIYTFGNSLNGRLGRLGGSLSNFDHKPTIVNGGSCGGLSDQKIKKIACGINFTTIQSESGQLWSFGVNSKGQCGIPPIKGESESIDRPTLISCLDPSIIIHSYSVGNEHVVVLSDDGQVYCYGDNTYYQCGKGQSLSDNLKLIKVDLSSKQQRSTVYKVSAGGNNTMISLSSDHHIFGEELLKSLTWENKDLFTDVKIIINRNYDSFIVAHKVILASRCKLIDQLFRAQLLNPNQQQSIQLVSNGSHGGDSNGAIYKIELSTKLNDKIMYLSFNSSPVNGTEINFQILESLLKYLYSDHTNTCPLLGIIANLLKIDRLSYLCNQNKRSLDKLPISTLFNDFKVLKEQSFLKVYSDVQFNCKSNENHQDNGILESYKLFMYIGSTVFKNMFSGNYSETHKSSIDLNETTISGITSLVNYCYSEEIPTDINQCIEMIIICDAHQMIRAKELIASQIRNHLDNSSICYIYHLSILYNVKPLKIWCLAKLNQIEFPELSKLPYFDQLPSEIQSDLQGGLKK